MTILRALLLMIAIMRLPVLMAEDSLIADSGNPITSLSDDAVRDVFIGKKTSWDDGSRIVIVMTKEGSSHDNLMQRLGKSSAQFITGWKKLIFTGKGFMPEQVDNDEALVAFVAKTPGAIGFIDKSKVSNGVKIVPVQ